jgi:hypothetical protein
VARVATRSSGFSDKSMEDSFSEMGALPPKRPRFLRLGRGFKRKLELFAPAESRHQSGARVASPHRVIWRCAASIARSRDRHRSPVCESEATGQHNASANCVIIAP